MKDPRKLTVLGLSFLILFNVLNFLVRRFVPPSGSFAEGILDGAAGAALGVAAASILMAVWMRGRGRHTPCA